MNSDKALQNDFNDFMNIEKKNWFWMNKDGILFFVLNTIGNLFHVNVIESENVYIRDAWCMQACVPLLFESIFFRTKGFLDTKHKKIPCPEDRKGVCIKIWLYHLKEGEEEERRIRIQIGFWFNEKSPQSRDKMHCNVNQNKIGFFIVYIYIYFNMMMMSWNFSSFFFFYILFLENMLKD